MRRKLVYTLTGVALMLTASLANAANCDEGFCITAWTLASGGVIEAESDDGQWTLSGTIGQWEATKARQLSGGPWRLTGGFWGLTLEELADRLFQDRFESLSN
ncbi:MAG: hypothetical protein ACXIUL_03895 [Wenzhouxiangella sp.]